MIPIEEDQEAFLARRAAEERRRMRETSCMVRAVHEDLAETYEERLEDAHAVTASLAKLAESIADVGPAGDGDADGDERTQARR